MDEFKISLFKSEYKEAFPGYTTLSVTEGQNIRNNIAERYSLDLSAFEIELASKQSLCSDFDAIEGFGLKRCLAYLGISPVNPIFVNWYQFERVDAFNIDDLDKYFYDIWFPTADDIDLLDETLKWIISIRHDGCVTFLKQQ